MITVAIVAMGWLVNLAFFYVTWDRRWWLRGIADDSLRFLGAMLLLGGVPYLTTPLLVMVVNDHVSVWARRQLDE